MEEQKLEVSRSYLIQYRTNLPESEKFKKEKAEVITEIRAASWKKAI